MAAEAAVASTVVVAGEAFTVAVVVEGSTVGAEAELITARPAAAAMAGGTAAPSVGAEITIRCLLAAHILPVAPATLTAQPVTEDTRRATVATVQRAIVPA
jgi:hypothetical protein